METAQQCCRTLTGHVTRAALDSAKKAMANYGTNARLVEQNGTGHCAIGQASLCSAKIVSRFRHHSCLAHAHLAYGRSMSRQSS